MLHPGDILADRYVIQARLGIGQSGVHTYAALDRSTDAAVVIKELVLREIEGWKSYDLFEREAQVLTQLQHPRIPRVITYFGQQDPDNVRLYLVMARVPGRSLAERLAAGWHPTEQEVRAIACQILDILEYLHGLEPPVTHRDLKPSNLVMDEEGQVHLVDFGGVLDVLRAPGGSTVVGTYGYMAPEQFSGHAVPASDLYGLGATLVHLSTGIPPAQLPHQQLRMAFRPLVRCSPVLADWLERLLEPVVEKRLGSATQARQALERPETLPVPVKAEQPGALKPYAPSAAQWTLAGGIAASGIAYLVLAGLHLEQTAALFIGLPTLLAMALALTPRSRSATGKILKGTTIALLLAGPVLREGFVCLLMAAPLFFLVGLFIGKSMDRFNLVPYRPPPKRLNVLVALPFVLLSLEGVHPYLSFPRAEVVSAERVVPAGAGEVERQLGKLPLFARELPFYLSIGFPRPLGAWGTGLQPGDRRVIHFAGGEGHPGYLTLEVAGRFPDGVRFRAISDSSHIAHWLDWQEAEVRWTPIDAGHTRVQWTMRYQRRLDPAWYFGPWERYAVRLAAGYLIDTLATPQRRP